MNADRHGLGGEGSGDGGHLAEMMRAEAELLSSHDTHQVIADRLGISLNMVQIWCRHLVQRSRLGRCTHVLQGGGKSEQQLSWDPYGQQDPRQGQGQQYLAPQQPYANQQSYGRPAFMPDLRYGPPPGRPPYQDQSPPGAWPPYPAAGYLGGYGMQQQHRKGHWLRNTLVGVVVMFVAGLVIGTVMSHGRGVPAASPANSPAASAAAVTAAASSPPAARPATANTVATFTGSGTENTARFTVTSTWKLVYSFSCSNFGQAGNFAVLEDGGNDFNGVTVNDLEISKSASTWAYNDAGTHYLEVDSECAWTAEVVDEP